MINTGFNKPCISFKQNWNVKKELPNSEIRLYSDGEYTGFDSFIIKAPKGILEDLKQCQKDLDGHLRKGEMNILSSFIEETGNFADKKIYGIPGVAFGTVVFDIGNDEVVKVSKENPFEYRKYNPKFDIPLLSQIVKYKNYFIYKQAKADVQNTSLSDVSKVKRRMKRAGYEPSKDFSDWRREQVGKYKGKAYLIDSRCALKMPNMLTRFTDWFEKVFDFSPKVYKLTETDADSFESLYSHVEEIPRSSYTKKEALAKIKKVIKSWK